VDSKGLIASLPDIAISDGAACDADGDPDYVLRAIDKPEAAHCSIRLQFGRSNTLEQIPHVIDRLSCEIRRMKAFAF
jgi:cysteine sulfinate desulfinase/cysteine desulfurase-like protein